MSSDRYGGQDPGALGPPRPANWQVFSIRVPVTSGFLTDEQAAPAVCRYLRGHVHRGQARARDEFARLGALEVGPWEWEVRPGWPGLVEAELMVEDLEAGADLPLLIVGACEVRLPDDVIPDPELVPLREG